MFADPGALFGQIVTGLATASTLFLAASGLSLVFGVTRIVNFAHGSLYMLGAYFAWSLTGTVGFWGAVGLAALLVGLLGAAIETGLLRRIYRAPDLYQLLATFGLVLIIQDAALYVWGPEDRLGPLAPGLRGRLILFGQWVPLGDLFVIAAGPVVLGGLWLLLHRTRFGVLVRAAREDREMVAALGTDQRLLFTAVFVLGSVLAGLGGALTLVRGETVNLHMDLTVIVDLFVIVVIGGLGSIGGAYLAAVLIGVAQALLIVAFPKITLVVVFLIMALVLSLRPHGLLGRAERHGAGGGGGAGALLPEPPAGFYRAAGLGLGLLGIAGFWMGEYTLTLATDIAIFALFAASLHLLMGPGGLASFGHAAWFGLGAYGAALLVRHGGLGSDAPGLAGGLAVGMAGAGLAGLLFGALAVRLSGVYLAMLTLAFAQICWSLAFQWVELTGGDNGLLGIWPGGGAAARAVYFALALALCGGTILLLRRLIHAPFGYALRAARDAPARAAASGVPVAVLRWAAFGIAAAAAGLAGALFAFAKGAAFPSYLSIARSVDGLLMVLLGGVQSASGPVLGAVGFTLLAEHLTRMTDYWRLWLGLAILALVLALPRGLAGLVRWRRP